jgi:hypothetical protein
MPRAKIRSVIEDFRADVRRSNDLLTVARARGIPFFRVEQIAELSYLKIYLAWESFLEESFIRFLSGARTLSGRGVSSYVTPSSLDHARDVLTGLDKGGRYADWAKREVVTERARLLFKNGTPFVGPLQAAASDLNDMRTMRDCIAHRSAYVQRNFGKVVLRRLGVAHQMHPGRFLLRNRPGSAETYLQFFSRVILAVAEQIVA